MSMKQTETEYTDVIELQKEAPYLKEFTEDIICRRIMDPGKADGIEVSIPQKIRYHSLDFEWGYGGSGPADLALNILYCFFDFNKAWKLHQMFKWTFIDIIPWEGGIIENEKIKVWIKEKLEEED